MAVRQLGAAPSRTDDAATKGYVDTRGRTSFEPGSSNGLRRYVRLATLRGSNAGAGAHVQFLLSGTGDYGTNARATTLVHFVQRGNDTASLKAWSFDRGNTQEPVDLYYKRLDAFTFELWARFADWNYTHDITWLSSRNCDVNLDSQQTASPSRSVAWTGTADASTSTATESGITRTNLILNPALRTTRTNWGIYGGAGASHTNTWESTYGIIGNGFGRIAWTVASTNASGGWYWGGAGGAPFPPVTAGTTYAASAYLRSNVGKNMSARILWHDDAGATLSITYGATTAIGTNWVRVSATGVAPTGATKATIQWYLVNNTWNVNDQLDIAAALFEASTTVRDYFDGSYAADLIDVTIGNVATEDYVDRFDLIPAGTNLDTLTTTGRYSQNLNANASLALNYPSALAGLLEVFKSPSSTLMVWQRYTTYASGNAATANITFTRTKYSNGAWTAWEQDASKTYVDAGDQHLGPVLPASSTPQNYPNGVSLSFTNAETGWPGTYLTVVTHKYAGTRTVQEAFTGGASNRSWRRTAINEAVWGEWTETTPSTSRMIGEIVPWAGSTATVPAGWFACDGDLYDPALYPDLWNVIGTTYGQEMISADNAEGFVIYGKLPDLRGRVPVGSDPLQTEFDTLGEAGGAKTHTLTVTEMPSHTHTEDVKAYADHGVGMTADFVVNGGGTQRRLTTRQINGREAVNPANTGGGQPHNNLPPYLTVNYIIKAKYTSTEVAPTATHVHARTEVTGLDKSLPRQGTIEPYYTHGATARVQWTDMPAGQLSGPYGFAQGYNDPVPGAAVVGIPFTYDANGATNYILERMGGGQRQFPYWFAPTLGGGWVNYNAGYTQAGFTKNSSGIVMLKGLIKSGSITAGTVLFTLPEGFRPATKKMFLVACDSGTNAAITPGRIDVNTNGQVVVHVGVSNWTSLDSIFFMDAATENSLTWTPITLGTGWVNYNGGGADLTWTGAARAVDSYGRVWHRGLITRASGAGAIWASSPGFAPGTGGTLIQRVAAANGWGAIDIDIAGGASHRTGGINYISLDQVIYPLAGATYSWSADKQASFTAGWSNYATPPWTPVGAIGYPDRMVILNGLLKHTTTSGRGVVFGMPGGYQSSASLLIPLVSNGVLGRIDVQAGGSINVVAGDTSFISLHCAYFAEA